MPKKKLDQYTGRLTPSQVAEGMNAARANAARLVVAAELVGRTGDYALAASLAALSIEESGKLQVLRSLAVARDDKDLADAWRAFRSHTKKNVMWPLLELVAKGARRLDDFQSLFREDAEHPFLLDQVKQLGIYTDCLGKAHWAVPTAVIEKELADALVRTARLLSGGQEVHPEEIQLWIKCVGPVWKGPKEKMEHGLAEWYRQMQLAGLAEAGDNAMEEFILKGIGGTKGGINESRQEPSP